MTDTRPCPFAGCPLEKSGCPSEYKDQCVHQAEVILDAAKLRLKEREDKEMIDTTKSGGVGN